MSPKPARKASSGSHHKPAKAGKRGKGKPMKSAPDPEGTAVPNGEAPEGANVDKIRDILFGSQMRDYEKRFIRLEERLAKDAADLREETKKRLDTLESFVHEEFESVAQRLKNEKSERTDALKDLERETHDATKSLEKKHSHLDDEVAKGMAELRSRILEQSKALMAEIEGRHRDLTAALDRDVKTLQDDKTDRRALADLFTEVALRLKEEFVLPEEK